MKYCPSCQSAYADDSLRFCLEDGAVLRSYAGNSQLPTQDLSERETVIRQKPVTSDWEQSRITRVAAIRPETKRFNQLPAVILTALTMCVVFGGLTGAWLWISGGNAEYKTNFNSDSKNRESSPVKTNANTGKRIQNNKTGSRIDEFTVWEPINDNVSLNGENLTYYRGTTVERCRADCGANPLCKGFTYIKAGGYNAGDPPMCYLAAEITHAAAHACCISAVKSEYAAEVANTAR